MQQGEDLLAIVLYQKGGSIACKPGSAVFDRGLVGVHVDADGPHDRRAWLDLQMIGLSCRGKLCGDPSGGAGVIIHSMCLERRRHGGILSKFVQYSRKAGQAKDRSEQGDGLSIRKGQALIDGHHRIGAQAKGGGFSLVGRTLGEMQDRLSRHVPGS